MSVLDVVKSILRPQATALKAIDVSGSVNYAELPLGFFRVETASGKKSLGYSCPTLLSWDVGTTVVVGGNRITLDVPQEQLPLVRLNFQSQAAGVQQVGGHSIIDTERLDGWDGEVAYEGSASLREGVDFV